MRQFLVLILLLTLNLAAAPGLRAEPSDPSDLFLSAYMSVQKGQKLEEDGKYKLALQKYRYAASLLQQIKEKSPDWQPLIVGYRLNKTSEAIATIEKRISVEGPGSTQDVEPTLPTKGGDDTAPNVNVTPPDNATTTTVAPPSSGDPIDAVRAKFQDMQNQLNEVKRKYAEVQREKEELADKLDTAQKELNQSKINESQLKSKLTQAEEAYANMVKDNRNDAEGQKQYKDEIARLQNLIKDAQAERDAAEDANEEVTQRAKNFKSERDVAMKERDEAVDSLKKAKEGQQQVEKLMSDNASLMQKLNDAEKTIAQFSENAPAKDAEIAKLKKDAADAREQLTAALKQSQENLNSMNDLQQQLESATNELAEAKGGTVSTDDRKKLNEENELLRGIVIRERKEEAHRDQEKKLALEELGKLHIQSDALVEKLTYLTQPVLKLTDQELALFKQPEIAISDNNISISVARTPNPADASPAPAQTPAPAMSTPAPTEPAATPAVLATTPAPDASAAPSPAPSPMPDATPAPTPADKTDAGAPHVEVNHPAPPVSKELVPQANEAKDEFDRGHYREAEKIYIAMMSVEPNNIYIRSNLGVVQFRSGKLKPAEETFRKAIAVAPDDEFSHRTLGIVYYTEGKLEEAVGELTKSLTLNPKDAIAHNYLGITCSAKGWQEAARKELETAVAIDPNYSDAHFNLAVIYLTTTPYDKENAKKHYKRAVELGSQPDAALEQLLNKP